jgi:2-methylcitrate dehydratase PrpD
MSAIMLARHSKVNFPFQSTDKSAADPRIDDLRAKIYCVEDKQFSIDYHEPAKRSIGNAVHVELNDGTLLNEVEIEYPVGHKRRREEGTPLLMDKFKRHISHHYDEAHQNRFVCLHLSLRTQLTCAQEFWKPFLLLLRCPSFLLRNLLICSLKHRPVTE